MKSARPKREADDVLSRCQAPLDFPVVFEYLEWAKGTEPAKDIAKGQRGIVYNIKNFVTALPNILDQKELSRVRTNMQQIHSETTSQENNSSVEQQIKTSSRSRKYVETRTATVISGYDIFGDVSVEIGGGLKIPFLIKSSAKATIKVGGKISELDTKTNTVTEETTVTIEAQTVRCPARKRMDMAWNYFTYTDTIEYLLDLELDPDNSYFGALEMELIRNNDDSLSPVRFKRVRECTPLRSFTDDFLDSISQDTGISRKNGKMILENVPLIITIKACHGLFRTQESDL